MSKTTQHILLAFLVTYFYQTTPVEAEGSLQLGPKQALQASTDLVVDIIDADKESIRWVGVGELQIMTQNNVIVASLASGDSYSFSGFTENEAKLKLTANQQVDTSWDITVTSESIPQDGRLHSQNWYFNAASFASTHAVQGSFYALVPGGKDGSDATIELKLNGLAGYVYQINANTIGVNGPNGGKSVPGSGNSTTPEFPIYLAPPKRAQYGRTTPAVSSLRFVGGTDTDVFGASKAPCQDILPGKSTGEFVFESNVEGSYHLICDLNQDGSYDRTGNNDLLLIGQSTIGKNTAAWDGSLNWTHVHHSNGSRTI